MGRLGYDPVIQHFSHPHPLQLSSLTQPLFPASCACCKLSASGCSYTCKTCNYFLHVSCSQMPQLIHHPADADHALSLLPIPAYPEGCFNCDACGRQGTGFSYHCGTCGLDIHTLCASKPLSVNNQSHHHPLTLAFFPPYDNKGFSCDICTNLGSNHWLYRCAMCEFDAHLGCATATPQVQAPVTGFPNRPRQGITSQGGSQVVNCVGSNGASSGLMRQTVQGLVNGAAEQIGGSVVQSFFGGGSGNGSFGSGGGQDGYGTGSASILNMGSTIMGGILGGSDSSSG